MWSNCGILRTVLREKIRFRRLGLSYRQGGGLYLRDGTLAGKNFRNLKMAKICLEELRSFVEASKSVQSDE